MESNAFKMDEGPFSTREPFGLGLTFAEVALPLLAFGRLSVVVSVGMLGGSVS